MAYKTFVVERTEDESTQTAGPATLNRADVPPLVKVFDDESDIVLSTLSTNEIVATKNTDYSSVAVVDRVAKDNLNPVTSNAVATALSYSTDETLTGGYWIDGKPIYRKVLQCTQQTTLNSSDDWKVVPGWTIAGISTLVSVRKNNTYSGRIDYQVTSSQLKVYCILSLITIAVGDTLIIEYTKTGD